MPDLGDQLRRWADQAEPVSADEARSRAAADTDLAPGRASRRPDRRAWLAVAAAALVVVGIGVAIAARSGDDPGDDIRTVPSPTTTVPDGPTATSTTTTPTTSTPGPLYPASLPPHFVAHDPQHRLVVIDSRTGQTIRVLDSFDDPDATPPEGEPAGMGRYLGRFDVGPADGGTVYFETCCEPAVGEVFRVPIAGGEPERVTYGTDPAVSPDGTKLAVVEVTALKVVDLRTGEETTYPIADNSPVVDLAHPSWSPDGTQLALERYDESIDRGRVVVVTFDGAEDVLNAATTLTEADDQGTPTFPTWVGDDQLLVARQRAEDGNPTTAHMERYSTNPPALVESGVTYPQRVLTLDRSAGGFVARLLADGTIELGVTPDGIGNVVTDLKLLDAAW